MYLPIGIHGASSIQNTEVIECLGFPLLTRAKRDWPLPRRVAFWWGSYGRQTACATDFPWLLPWEEHHAQPHLQLRRSTSVIFLSSSLFVVVDIPLAQPIAVYDFVATRCAVAVDNTCRFFSRPPQFHPRLLRPSHAGPHLPSGVCSPPLLYFSVWPSRILSSLRSILPDLGPIIMACPPPPVRGEAMPLPVSLADLLRQHLAMPVSTTDAPIGISDDSGDAMDTSRNTAAIVSRAREESDGLMAELVCEPGMEPPAPPPGNLIDARIRELEREQGWVGVMNNLGLERRADGELADGDTLVVIQFPEAIASWPQAPFVRVGPPVLRSSSSAGRTGQLTYHLQVRWFSVAIGQVPYPF